MGAPKANVTRVVALAAVLAAALVATMLIVDRDLDGRLDEVSRVQTRTRLHIEWVTSIRRDARKTYVAALERSLKPRSEWKGAAPAIEAAAAAVEGNAGEFAASEEAALGETPLRQALATDVRAWRAVVSRILARVEIAGDELRERGAAIDARAEAVLDLNSRAAREADERLAKLEGLRRRAQLGFTAGSVAVLVASLWWRSRVKAEARLAAAEQSRVEQEAIVKRQGEFFATMSHELRTPLVAVRTFASEIAETPSTTESARRAAESIEREAKDLLAIIGNILDAAKLDAGKTELLIEDVALRDVVDRCVARCRPLLEGKSVELAVDLPDEPLTLRGDRVKLQQIVTNLLSNAAKFTDEGSITVRGRADGAGAIAIEIEDTGAGIAADALEDIWQPFRQVDGAIARRHGGAGLGLSIVRGLVEKHGGRVVVSSELGRGTKFRVVLPRAS